MAGSFSAAEIAVAVLLPVRVRLAPVLRGIAYDCDRGQAVLPDRIGAPNSWVRSMDGLAGVSSGHDIGPRSIRGGL